ncbi:MULTISPECIES: SufE family protein [Salinicola]|uniref:Fe-S cluster assembly protein SufE n=1 Tax=Salinicola socius TaxID=404433 RepID=A0A1Q8SVN6_9GAMM|nr:MULTISPECIES: SufE family protein [Salinicola]OLO05518.1 Fe-S cluster assembly protein SufE [Salinicola socius]
MSIGQAQAELRDEFSMFDNWMDRYQYIIDMGRQLPDYPEADKAAAYKIEGCQSNVWLRSTQEAGRLRFQATSDAAIVSGLIAILMRIYDDREPREILEGEPQFLTELGLDQHLSPTRSNGLHAMIERIYGIAREAHANQQLH